VNVPLPLDYAPMEARTVEKIPDGQGWQFEPKWDGFRCLAFRDGDEIKLRSKSGQPLERYFPEIVEALAALGAMRFVLDGELVVATGDELSFDDLLLRIHPAASRVLKLARDSPATYLVFDLLVDGRGKKLVDEPLAERRPQLERFAGRYFPKRGCIRLSPASTERKAVDDWYARVGGALDGIVAKRLDQPYRSGKRDAMIKVKAIRTADCVVAGFRYAQNAAVVGSLLLGLFDDEGLLHYVGFTSAFPASERKALLQKLKPLEAKSSFTGRSPGGPSRWTRDRDTTWQPLQPKLVLEVAFDQITGGRFRHGTRPIRWRPDKSPRQCTFDQIELSDRTMRLFH
jgi:ATP-dependent DNA ligase